MQYPTTNIIVGHTTKDSVKIWTKSLDESAEGRLILMHENREIASKLIQYSSPGYTHTSQFTGLSPATEYRIHFINGEKVYQGSCRTFPEESPTEINFVFSSCLLNHNVLIRKKQRVFQNLSRIMKATNSAFMIFCGDQIYIDTMGFIAPKKPLYQDYERKYVKNWSLNGAAAFFANNCSYMILDDHEITNDFDNSNSKLDDNKRVGLQVYNDYQDAHNPTTPDDQYFYDFEYGHLAFFVMDTRTERNRELKYIISQKQQEAFTLWLMENQEKMKVVISPVPFIIQPCKKEEKWSDQEAFQDQYHTLITHLIDQEDEKICFITGDYHSAIHGSFEVTKGTKKFHWHEFMAGPLNQAFVNPAVVFDKERTILENNEVNVHYTRHQVEAKYTNACHVNISSDDDFYYVQGAWYRVQHESKAYKIADTQIISIPRN